MSRSNRKKADTTGNDARPGVVPAGTPDWITAELIEKTIRVWQPYYADLLSPEDAVTMVLTVGRLYQALSSGSPP